MNKLPVSQEVAIGLAKMGAPLSVEQFRAILGCSRATFTKRQRMGDLDRFRLPGDVGPQARYSGNLVTKWLNGEHVFHRVFGGKRK